MAYPQPHVLLRAGGHFGSISNSVDQWSVGLRFGVVGSAVDYSPGGLEDFAVAAATAFGTFHTATSVNAGSACYLSWTTAARVGTDGKYLPETQETARYDFPTPVQGNGPTSLPWNTSQVVSLRTARPRGYASNGRMYYPATGQTVTATSGLVASGTTTARVAAAKALFDSLNSAANTYDSFMRLCVMSAVGSGLAAYVSHIRSDGRLDSIERRESAIPLTWYSADLA